MVQETTTELVAVLIAVTHFSARVLTINEGHLLPSGPLQVIHHSLQAGARTWVQQQTRQPLGYMEQLYTFVDVKRSQHIGYPMVYVSYLGLVKEADEEKLALDAKWNDWYNYFPWEDKRQAKNQEKIVLIIKNIQDWIDSSASGEIRTQRIQRMNLCWGLNGHEWQEEHVLLRYELMYEAGLIAESPYFNQQLPESITGQPMHNHHRRVLATAMTRLRAKLKYRPVIFDLMPSEFTLLQLQKSLEALTGIELHKQNFRRFIQHQNLIEATGKEALVERGRPAQLYRFKSNVLQESLLSGYKLPTANN
ncbi:NUDIX hydrolase [Acinetobacter rathckeae]|uniref:NUDIX hydrolase n=1 Tax=Acinetobacter rathckeae TaxID=2605272 RepID=UPI0018A27AB7|nr:hypothetical protein [Acinetobacter rathckeae]MBF7687885.1 hypothetical protein [Acinetobacter rathckeae]MBF7687892.1 hypothetical protein [Acinetobacter rathckeae]MBF7696055.1 hypothetical protein [Acinetobacter rathckeae]